MKRLTGERHDKTRPQFAVGDKLTFIYRPELYPGRWTVVFRIWEGLDARIVCGTTGKTLTRWKYVARRGRERVVFSEPCEHLVQATNPRRKPSDSASNASKE